MKYLTLIVILFSVSSLFSQSADISTVKEDIEPYMSILTDSSPSGITDITRSHRLTLNLDVLDVANSGVSLEKVSAILESLDGVTQIESIDAQSASLLIDPTSFSKQNFVLEFCHASGLRL